MSGLEEIVFDGGEGQCERFIRLVRKAAFSQGKLDDSRWVAMFASTCFEGKALRWYSALDPATKADWNLMEPALLTEFSGPVLNAQAEEKAPAIERESGIPTPAAAPPPPPAASEAEPSRLSSPISYEPAPAPAAAPPPPSAPEGRPPPPPRESSSPGTPGPPPPPPPRNSAFASSYQTGTGFRPPPRHPSAGASSASKPNEPTPGLYGSYIPTNNAAPPPPPPPRNSSFNSQRFQGQQGYGAPNPNEPRRENSEDSRISSTEHLDGESTTNMYERERRPYSTNAGPSPQPTTTGRPDNPNVDFFVAPDGTTHQNWSTNIPQPFGNPNDTPNNAAPPPPSYAGYPEPQSDLPSPPPPPPRRDPQFPPPPRRNPVPPQQPGPQFPNAGPMPAGAPPQYTGGPGMGVPPQFTGGPGVGVPPQFTGGPGVGVPPQYTGPWPGFQQPPGTGYQVPPPPPPFGGPNMARRGRIRVMDPSGGMYWARDSLNWFGGFKRTSKIGEAVVSLWDPVNQPGRLKLLRPINNHLWMGLTWATVSRGMAPVLGKGSKEQADLAAVTEMPSGITSSASHREGPSQAAVWFINSDMTLEARVPGPNGVQYTLDVAVGSGTKWIWLVSDFDTFALSNVGQIKSWLVFEPI